MKTRSLKIATILFFCTLLLLASARAQTKSTDMETLKPMNEIITSMNKAAMEWNKGNLEGYMALYDQSATMMMTDKRIGLDSMRKIYIKYYFDGNHPKQQLSYDHYQLTMLGKNYALLTGIFILRANDTLPERKGRFSVVLVRRHNAWLLLHDHSG